MRETILMKKNSGFTLMEVMVTIGIIAIVSAIAIPNYISWLPKHRMSGATRDIYSAMQYARMRAVKEKILQNESLKVGHIITGNRLRKKGKVKFSPKVKTYRPNGFSEYIAALSMGIFAKILAYKYCNITTGVK